ncbi:protein adenylyltransferase SelO family protein [Corynebacterium sp. TA-R-1]|uniref:Protein nucleotidyltransferase YdiU n=1 Tax=Corynebacterium stercoris TaxID=2943490 RepID=A0ABT1FXW0_9CORY|nr:protein adenylyltransferase SelO family protein [Corynebacterium stercoris]MCP1386610.1 protein adenylyltransferase SelO family protein [Corynebacterium stercoris]
MAQPNLNHTFAAALPDMVREVPGTHFPAAELVVLNEPLARDLGLDPAWLRSADGVQWLTGAAGGHATAYAGHQFGQCVPVLGDGRALLLGDIGGRELQLKGSGRTPFSRPGSDGFGALGPMLREYLVSEFMHAVGVPTTRSLAVLTTGDQVIRQQGQVPGGIVVRVSQSHLRVGSVQYAATQSEALVADVVAAAGFEDAGLLLADVMSRQMELVARWMRIGFVHGVMNTDNTTLSGETIDYGPCAFTERFVGNAVFSSIDRQGRYAFGNQPTIIAWNLARLAEALLPVIPMARAQTIVGNAQNVWDEHWAQWVGEHADGLAAAEDITTYNREHGINGEPGPIFIPRNGMLETAIAQAEQHGNLAPYRELLAAVTDPYNPEAGPEWMKAPEGAFDYTTFCGT